MPTSPPVDTSRLDQVNDTAYPFPSEQTLHGLLEDQVRRVPGKAALIYKGEVLTYAEFNAAANRWAHHLRGLGVSSGSLVGVCLERCAEQVVVIYGILKAGGTYVPLDPFYPKDRLALMVDDSQMSFLITNAERAASLPPLTAQTIDVTSVAPLLLAEPSDDLPAGEQSSTASDIAYVIYTSGSTGKPKGVMVPHRGVVNFLFGMQRTCKFTEHEVSLAANTAAFDISIPDLFLNFAVGATLVVAPQEASFEGGMIAELLERYQVTNMLATPSGWRILLESGWQGLPNLRIIAAGEALPNALAKDLLSKGRSLWNAYGPTEVTVIATFFEVVDPTQKIYIGKPIQNVQLYILDEQRQRVPYGEVGEIFIAGAGVTRGYLKRPELTAERYLANPFTPAGKLYKTGDLGRFTASGDLEYLGRCDDQVKIRGFRIELGDVEAALLKHPALSQAVANAVTLADLDQNLVAYYTVRAGMSATAEDLRTLLSQSLPRHMVPNHFVMMTELPLTPNGKTDRRSLPLPAGLAAPAAKAELAVPPGDVRKALTELWQELFPQQTLGPASHFFELGGTSLLAIRMLNRLRRDCAIHIPALQLFQYPTLGALSAWYDAQQGAAPAAAPAEAAKTSSAKKRRRRLDPEAMKIAVIGMALRCPGADDIHEFWDNLVNGIDSITHFGPDELDASVSTEEAASPNYVRARGIVRHGDCFDAGFFGISKREAEAMDPQHRQFLETAWQALEHGGYQPEEPDLRIGVYAGTGTNTYFPNVVQKHPSLIEQVGAFQAMVGNEKDYVTTRVMHRFNMTGPAVSIQTACSTSLVAIHLAVQALRLGECDMAIAGGTSSTSPLKSGYLYQEGAMLSADGRTRTFSSDANGTVFADGVGAVLLKRLSDALADGDQIHGVIIGTAINNDGANKASFTAPSVAGQAAVITQAMADAEVDAASISYVEAHGTATPLGDPIEVAALTQAYRATTDARQYCAIGSVKSNIGHLTAAAGVAGLIKTCLSLTHRQLPATLHVASPNPKIDFANSPFVINDRLRPWTSPTDVVRRAAVSSFGVGGTNAHVVVEEAPAPQWAAAAASGPQLLVYSAKTATALESQAQQLAAYFSRAAAATTSLRDAAYTLMAGRKALPMRGFVVADSLAQAASLLPSAGVRGAGKTPATAPRVAFLFPGQGSQMLAMGRGLYEQGGVFRAVLDEAATILNGQQIDLLNLLYGEGGDSDRLTPTQIAQPALFAVSYALARHWQSLGLQPQVLLGHSVGEFVAAAVAGVLSWQDALLVVSERGRLMQSMPSGSMLSVRMPEGELLAQLPASLAIAANNSPDVQVVAGPSAAIAAFAEQLTQRGVAARMVRTSHAFHTFMMQDAADGLAAYLATKRLQPPNLAIISTLTGQLLTPQEATSPEYWSRQLRSPVAFAPALRHLLASQTLGQRTVLLEVGPGEALTKLAKQQLAPTERPLSFSSLGASTGGDEARALLATLGHLWLAGVPLSPQALVAAAERAPRRISLPTYPFERQRYWPQTATSVADL